MNSRSAMSLFRLLLTVVTVGGLAVFSPGILGSVNAQDATATLTIEVFTCSPGYDPVDPQETLVNPCNLGTEDIGFTLEPLTGQSGSAMASTGTGGAPATISFSNLAPGDYRLMQQTPGSIGLSFVLHCASSVREFDYPFAPFAMIESGGRLNIQLLAGEQLDCAWYNVQADPSELASLTLTAYNCSGDVIDPAICDLAAGVTFELTSVTGIGSEQIVTGANGVATFDGAGDYRIEAVSELPDREFCSFDHADPVTGGQITLDPANPIELEAYYCYPGA